MKNFTNPIQPKQNFVQLKLGYEYEMNLVANQFEDQTDSIGFIKQDPEKYSFLQYETYREEKMDDKTSVMIKIGLDSR